MGNWLRDALLKKWCEDNGVKIKEIDMNGMDAKAFIDDWREGLNKEEKDMTKAEMRCMEDKDAYIEELKNENAGLKYQLDMKRTEISELQDAVREKVRGVELATDRYVQVSCANTRLVEENVALKKEKDKMSGCIVDLQINLMKAEDENVVLKKQITECNRAKLRVLEENTALRTALSVGYIASKPEAKQHDDTVDSTRYLAVLAKKKRAEEMIKSLKQQMFIYEAMVEKLKGQNESFKKQVDDINLTKKKALDKDTELIESLEKEIKRLEYTNNDLDNNVKDMFATIRSLKKDKANLKDNLGFLSVKLQKRDEIIHDLKDDNEELKAEIEVLLEKNYDLDNHVKNLVAQVETLDREKSELTNELNSVVDNYDKSAISLKKEVLKKDDEIRTLKYQLDISKKRADASIRTLKAQLNEAINSEGQEISENDIITDIQKHIAWIEKHMKNLEACVDNPDDAWVKYVNDNITIFENRLKTLEDGTLFTNDMITGACVRLDKIEKTIGIDLNLSEVKKDIEEKQVVIDTLKDLDQRISWILTHLNNAETEAIKSFKKLEDDYAQVNHCMTNAFVRINKLEEAQEKKSAKKTTKKTQKSELS